MIVHGVKVTVKGSTIKNVRCEACQCQYVYEMVRQKSRTSDNAAGAGAFGAIGALAMAGVSAATGGNDPEKLRADARKSLERELARTCDPVACPACGWYQADMVKEARKRYRTWMLGLGATLMVLGGAPLLIMLVINTDPHTAGRVSPLAFAAAGALVIAGVTTFVCRWRAQRGFDINQGYPSPRPPYPGAPTGYDVKQIAQAPGSAQPLPASRRGRAEAETWFYVKGEAQAGPVTWSALKRLVETGNLAGQDLVYAAGSADWVEVSSVPGLMTASV